METELPWKMARFASAEPPPSRLHFGVKGDTFRLGGQLLALRLVETEGLLTLTTLESEQSTLPSLRKILSTGALRTKVLQGRH